MAFKFRYRIKDKEGKTVRLPNCIVALTQDGNPFIIDTSDYYMSVKFVGCEDYNVEVATEKVDGKWVYKPI